MEMFLDETGTWMLVDFHRTFSVDRQWEYHGIHHQYKMGHPKVEFFLKKKTFPYNSNRSPSVSLDHLDQEFYEMCKTKLNPDGILVTQAASGWASSSSSLDSVQPLVIQFNELGNFSQNWRIYRDCLRKKYCVWRSEGNISWDVFWANNLMLSFIAHRIHVCYIW